MKRVLRFISLFILVSCPIPALGAGDVQGTLKVNDKIVPIHHGYASLYDNAEGWLSYPNQLRILLTDREVPPNALFGSVFLPVEDLAREGKMQGLLLQFNPDDHREVSMILLSSNGSFQTVTAKISIKNLKLTDQLVTGTVEHPGNDTPLGIFPNIKFEFLFSLSLMHEPAVTADLKGKAALASPQVKVLPAIAEALIRTDFAALDKLSSERISRLYKEDIARRGSAAKIQYKQMGMKLKNGVAKVKRVVVRGDRATVLFSDALNIELVQIGGEWKLGGS